MSDIRTNIVIVAFLIVFNGILAMSEAALISARRARLQHQSEAGDRRAGTALRLLENPNLFLSVIQIGITLIDVLIGAIGGEALGEFLAIPLRGFAPLAPYSEVIGLVIGVLVITYFSIILGELVPKRLALRNSEGIAAWVAAPMLFLARLLTPIVRFLSFSTEIALRTIGLRPSKEPPVTEEEIRVLIAQGTQAGVFEEAEQDMVSGVFRLGDRRVYSLMTPRPEIVWLDIKDAPEEILRKIAASPYSRFPVCQGGLDNVLGIVRARDLLVPSQSGEEPRLKDCLQPALFIPETTFASRALEIFKEQGREIVLVIDEYGGVQGLLTLHDVLTEIVGEIETGEPQATQRPDGSWLLDGMLDVSEFKSLFNIEALPEEDDFETLGGFVMTTLKRIPKTADRFEWKGLRFEVVDMDGRRVDKVLVTTLPAKPASS